ncbi:hypothetical protein TgHK011_009141 [Trichoderma gracile]|nr:hypothetical protein TgHK011_009141 [Trichoderma gracile]
MAAAQDLGSLARKRRTDGRDRAARGLIWRRRVCVWGGEGERQRSRSRRIGPQEMQDAERRSEMQRQMQRQMQRGEERRRGVSRLASCNGEARPGVVAQWPANSEPAAPAPCFWASRCLV